MDDNNVDVYSVFDIPRRPKSTTEEQWHRESERRAMDTIRVKNPTDTAFSVEWDHRYHTVPAHGTRDVPRYIAVKYCRDMSVDLINKKNQELHDKALEERSKKGLPKYGDKYIENNETYMTQEYPRTNDSKILASLYSDLWVGIVATFGLDTPPNEAYSDAANIDITPAEVQLLRGLENRRVDLSAEAFNIPTEAPVVPESVIPTPQPNATKTKPKK